jgi:hypothetical protein
MIFRWVDAALLVDLSPELVLPVAVREAWEPLVHLAMQGQVEPFRPATAYSSRCQIPIPWSGAAKRQVTRVA